MEKTWRIHTGLMAQSVQCTLYTGQASSRSCQYRGAYREKQHSRFEMFIAPLETDSNFVYSANANSCTRCRCIFKGLPQYEGRSQLADDLRASPYNKELSNKTTFSLIHLAGQYL